MRRLTGHLIPTVLVVAALVSCRADDEVPTDPVQLESVEDRRPPPADAPDGASGAGAEPSDQTPTAADSDADDLGEDAAADGAVVDGAAPTSTQLPVDLGPAGTVVVEVTGEVPGIADLRLGDGWRERERDLDDDELELTLVRNDGRGEAVLELELDGTHVEVHVEVVDEAAAAGRIRLPDGGATDVTVEGDTLGVAAFTAGDGWRVTERDQDDDAFEVTLERERVRWRLELEADEGRLELRLDIEATYRR